MKLIINKLLLLLQIVFLCSFLNAQKLPKNVILIIGDNKGIESLFSNLHKTTNLNNLSLFSKSYHKPTGNDYIDSGAAATAIACGVNSQNGMIGMNADSTNVKSLLTVANENGLSTGIITTCDITHSTPASFIAHQPNKRMTDEIALDIFNSETDVIIGGGKSNFTNRDDNRELLEEFSSKKYQVETTRIQLKHKKTDKFIALLADNHLPEMPKRGNFLGSAIETGIEILDRNKKGYFLVIEDSHIDWSLIDTESKQIKAEIDDFRKNIEYLLTYATHNKHTLIVLTSDQLKTEENSKKATDSDSIKTSQKKAKTENAIAIYSYGPGSETFKGTIKTISVKSKFISLLKLKEKR